MFGVLCDGGSFELMCGERAVGERRRLDETAAGALEAFAAAYRVLAQQGHGGADPTAGLLALGRGLYAWLDGENGALADLLQKADRPLRFEICTTARNPSSAEWALLRAPWELLADEHGFLAADVPLGFSPLRRLGRAQAQAPGQFRFGLAFMAASPRGANELDYEAEEAAILKAVEPERLDFLIEESGDPAQLAELLGDQDWDQEPLQALHLSCHGHNAWKAAPDAAAKPVLLLESDEGETKPTNADELIEALGPHRPRLLFLSACLTAAAGEARARGLADDKHGPGGRGGASQSLAEALVGAGFPATLGWDGSVADRAATAFAGTLYDRLEGRADLADAVAAARRALLIAPEGAPEAWRRDWHLARLWLGPTGGGRLVGGGQQRTGMLATHGEKEFLGGHRKVPVASREMFVGRRRELQTALRVLGKTEHAGIVLHGMGRLGKSSLAARVASRRKDLRLAVVHGGYGGRDILEALETALQRDEPGRTRVAAAIDAVRQTPDRLESELAALLCGPCARTSPAPSPVLLVIDDLEQILVADAAGGRHRVGADCAPALAATVRAFRAALDVGASRLLFTSRFPFALEGLEHSLRLIQLPPLSEPARRKLELRQREAAAPGLARERQALLPRAAVLARGNPGLQDLLGREIALKAATGAAAEAVLDQIEDWLAQGVLPEQETARAFLENLKLGDLLELAGRDGQALLRALTLFELPAPRAAADALEAGLGGWLKRLRDLGLVDVFADVVDPKSEALAANGLAAGRLAPLDEAERTALAALSVNALFEAWGGERGRGARPDACDAELARLGLFAGDGAVVACCAAFAVAARQRSHAAEAARFGQDAIALLDAQGRPAPLRLLSETAQAAVTQGDGAGADALLERGVVELHEQRAAGDAVDLEAATFLYFERARRLVTRGELDEAERIYRDEQLSVYERLGDARSRAVTLGQIADILFRRGELDEALRIYQHELLPVFERLGDARERAIALGQIADILFQRGELDKALRIRREEELPVYERLGDARSRAVSLGKIADILFQRGELDEALRIRRDEELPVYERLRDARERAIALGQIADILFQRGELAGARALQEERLDVHRRLGDADGIAATLWALAQIDLAEEKLGDAVPRIVEAYEIVLHLGRADGIAVVGHLLGQILAMNGQPDEARTVLRRAADMSRRLGREQDAQKVESLIEELKLGPD